MSKRNLTLDGDIGQSADTVGEIGTLATNLVKHDSATTLEAITMCPICIEEFEMGEQLTQLPCRHQFHPDCVE